MDYKDNIITLKDGRKALLRAPKAEDAAEMIAYLQKTSEETPFLLRDPSEPLISAEQEEKYLNGILASDNNLMIVCEIDGRIAGNCQISFNSRIKKRHRASVAIAILKEYWALGIGTAMFKEMIMAAKGRQIMQLELEFIEGNDRAKHLYEKMGFRIVSEKPNALRLNDGTILKEFFMIKEL